MHDGKDGSSNQLFQEVARWAKTYLPVVVVHSFLPQSAELSLDLQKKIRSLFSRTNADKYHTHAQSSIGFIGREISCETGRN